MLARLPWRLIAGTLALSTGTAAGADFAIAIANVLRAVGEVAIGSLDVKTAGDAFWSVTVYNADGYLEANDLGVNSYNNVSATPNDDGSYTLQFGGCEDGRINCIPTTPDWNYSIRLYEPRAEILDGSWTFPDFQSAD